MATRYQVNVPAPDNKDAQIMGALMGAGGSIAGNALLPGAGGAIGGALGGVVGSEMAGTKNAPGGVQAPQSSLAQNSAATDTAVQRRMEELRNQATIQQGLAAIEKNPALKQQYAPVLQTALERSRGGSMA